jgi:hypothetical protein
MKQIKPGDIGLTTIGGVLGFFVSLGQHLAGDSSKYTHAYIVLDDETVLAAQPGGARIDKLSDYKNKAVYLQRDLTDEQRATIVKEARALEGLPYSFLDYLALALARFGIKPQWLKKYIANTGHMICSQLCDEVYRRAGIHLFNDDRLPQEVTPGDLLYILAGEQDWITIEKSNANDI